MEYLKGMILLQFKFSMTFAYFIDMYESGQNI